MNGVCQSTRLIGAATGGRSAPAAGGAAPPFVKRPRFYSSRAWRAARRAALERDGRRCTRCGGAGRLEVHHVRPMRHGGHPLAPDNLRTLCRRCHFAVEPDRRTPRVQWREAIDGMVRA